MSALLRVEMILLALGITAVIIRSVNRQNLRLRYTMVWLAVAAALLLVAFFPGLVTALCRLTGIETPVNLLLVAGIFLLLLICFSQTRTLSRQGDQIKQLTQLLSIHLADQDHAGKD